MGSVRHSLPTVDTERSVKTMFLVSARYCEVLSKEDFGENDCKEDGDGTDECRCMRYPGSLSNKQILFRWVVEISEAWNVELRTGEMECESCQEEGAQDEQCA